MAKRITFLWCLGFFFIAVLSSNAALALCHPQCLEYVQGQTSIGSPYGDANGAWENAPGHNGWRRVIKGGTEVPCAGDVLYWDVEPSGHVAVIRDVDGDTVYVDDRNWDLNCGARNNFAVSLTNSNVIGWLTNRPEDNSDDDSWDNSEILLPVGNDDYSCIANKCWIPKDVGCWNAERWFEISGDESIDRDVNMCSEISGGSGPPPISDLHISSFKIKLAGNSDSTLQHSIGVTMDYGKTLYFEGKLKVRNKGNREIEDVDSDYRVDDDKDDFSENDAKVDEDKPFDIEPGEKVTKRMESVPVTISSDGKSVKVGKKTFPIHGNYKEIYFFSDVEGGGDKDISGSDEDEFGEVRITTRVPNYAPVGFADKYDCSGFTGWAKDDNFPENPVTIQPVVFDKNGHNGKSLPRFIADHYRSDVGSHAFNWSVPKKFKDGIPRLFSFYAINQPAGHNPLLKSSKVHNATKLQLTCAPAFGSTRPAYRFYNPSPDHLSHFFTISEGEKNGVLQSGWVSEGIGWYAFSRREINTVPIYRLYHFRNGKGHFYTASAAEKNNIANNPDWRYEAIAFYAYTYQVKGSVPIYRLYHHGKHSHFYTHSSWEKNSAINGGYHYEGVAFYALPMDYR